MNLFQKKDIVLNSGKQSDFKIECDALTDDDMECIAYLIAKSIKFKKIIGIPTGGIRLENALMKYCIDDKDESILICDDVLTISGSMERFRKELKKQYPHDHFFGIVIFARGDHPDWIDSLFKLNL